MITKIAKLLRKYGASSRTGINRFYELLTHRNLREELIAWIKDAPDPITKLQRLRAANVELGTIPNRVLERDLVRKETRGANKGKMVPFTRAHDWVGQNVEILPPFRAIERGLSEADNIPFVITPYGAGHVAARRIGVDHADPEYIARGVEHFFDAAENGDIRSTLSFDKNNKGLLNLVSYNIDPDRYGNVFRNVFGMDHFRPAGTLNQKMGTTVVKSVMDTKKEKAFSNGGLSIPRV